MLKDLILLEIVTDLFMKICVQTDDDEVDLYTLYAQVQKVILGTLSLEYIHDIVGEGFIGNNVQIYPFLI